jgi:hypothetical protein
MGNSLMANDPRAVANFILDVADIRGLPITNMSLNKIIYFAHGWSLGKRGKPLVSATFEAWQHGPVLPLIYRQFSKAGSMAISFRATAIDPSSGRVFDTEPDIAALEWLEMSVPAGSKERELRVRGREAYEQLSDDVLREAMERLVLASEIVRAEPLPERKRKKPKSETGDLFPEES